MIVIVKRMLKMVVPQKIMNIIRDMCRMIYHGGNYGIMFNPRYNEDGLITYHLCPFMDDPLFVEAYNLGKETGSWPNVDISWRAYVACWVANKVKDLEGDFVECGVNLGGLSRTIIHYLDFKHLDKKFYLLDTFRGIPEEFILEEERKYGVGKKSYGECYERVKEIFKGFENVVLIRGKVPHTLPLVEAEKVAYLSLDLNVIVPEIAAAEFFWDKMVSGGVMLLDDYAYSTKYIVSSRLYDEFAEKRNVKVLALPTGQGLIFKP
jgi:hypothetical protein